MSISTSNSDDISKEIIDSDKNYLIECLKKSQSIILSIVVISKGLINLNHIDVDNEQLCVLNDIQTKDDIILLNITHTDSYLQSTKSKINSLYNQLGAKYIFPLEIWQNNIKNTEISIGNINRYIYNKINKSNKMKQFKVQIMIDNIKQNIPKHNYVLSYDVIDFFSQICNNIQLNKIYHSKWIETLKLNNSIELIKQIELKYKIKEPIVIQDCNFSMTKKQIQYFKQYGIQENKILSKRKKSELDVEFIQNKKTKLNSANDVNDINVVNESLYVKSNSELNLINANSNKDVFVEFEPI